MTNASAGIPISFFPTQSHLLIMYPLLNAILFSNGFFMDASLNAQTVRSGFLRNDIDNSCQGICSINNRKRAFHNFNFLDRVNIDLVDVNFVGSTLSAYQGHSVYQYFYILPFQSLQGDAGSSGSHILRKTNI